MTDTDLAELREHVANEIQRRWVRPAAWDPTYRIPADQVSATAKSALDAMLIRDFRITPYPPTEEYEQLLTRVQHWIAQSEPIQVRIGYGPMKNPHRRPYPRRLG